MRRFLLLAILFCHIVPSAAAQTIISGRVLHAGTREPLSYVNIGISGASVGTISNPDGTFSLPIPDKHLSDALTFSAIGFSRRKVPIRYFLEHAHRNVLLNENITMLKEVVVTNKKTKPVVYEVGNKSVKGGVLETDTLYAGRSYSLLIDNKHHDGMQFPLQVETVNLRILRNNLATFKFRVRLNAVDPSGAPGSDLLDKSIIQESSMRKGWLTFDLSSFGYVAHAPFFITFEQITDVHDRRKIADGYREYLREHPEKLVTDTVVFEGKKQVHQTLRGGIDLPGTFIAIDNNKGDKYTFYTRETSMAAWTKERGIITAYATLSGNTDSDQVRECITPQCKIERVCKEFMDETGVAGLQLQVSRSGDEPISVNLGFADVARGVAVKSDTRFRINSISKSLTATALVTLSHEQKINLDAPVQQYVGEFPNMHQTFSLRQLAGHLAGIRDYNESDMTDFIRTKHYKTSTEAIEIIRNDTLLFSPGSRFHYSTFGWIIIGAAMESVKGEDYSKVMSDYIFKPMQLDHTSVDDITIAQPDRSKFYDAAGDENEYGDISYKYAGGGLLSTTGDLVRFGQAFLSDEHFNANAKAMLFTTQRTRSQQETGYGLGWYVGFDSHGHKIWHHSGDSFSSSSHLIIYPDHQIVIAFLANGQAGAAFDWQAVADIILAQEVSKN